MSAVWWVVLGVVGAAVLFAIAWVTSGPGWQGKTRGRGPDHASATEQEALAGQQARQVRQTGGWG